MNDKAWIADLPQVRGKMLYGEALAPFTWFRVGGPADVVFVPADEADLSTFIKGLDPSIPVTTIGIGSNLLIRDGGVSGVVIRLGRGFNEVKVLDDISIYAGSAVPDAVLARKAADAGIADLEFYAGIPGTVGGAIVMNAGCYGSETKNVVATVTYMNRLGEICLMGASEEFDFSYRHSSFQSSGNIVLGATFETRKDDPAAIKARMEAITARREQTQPIREKTGGSTFKNPEGKSAWQCVDEAGWRGRLFGAAKFSELHSNFMINTGDATAAELEGLGEAVRADVMTKLGIDLHWEIKRIGKS
ncbi:UDP-N-acetylmuramate dehydrogenase [Asticcacaulis sp.]|uniref:UDP-N-acetylmuramate dehydrogenase n=1 Tax=Asticcacaulis sp. TaxID=1872648 RepID=UPI002BA47E58|nr:UDP-N-acetylmuramate dehydrogenase [Asticcacaulis sp.]HTM80022.1 UDP-N-acetylmuramate dehydrogenase [Asticcacaulis sp.]